MMNPLPDARDANILIVDDQPANISVLEETLPTWRCSKKCCGRPATRG